MILVTLFLKYSKNLRFMLDRQVIICAAEFEYLKNKVKGVAA